MTYFIIGLVLGFIARGVVTSVVYKVWAKKSLQPILDKLEKELEE